MLLESHAGGSGVSGGGVQILLADGTAADE
jgi:hypothetical protein